MGETKGTRPSPEGLCQHVTGAPKPGVVVIVGSLTLSAVGDTKVIEVGASDPGGVYSLDWEPKPDRVKSIRAISKPRVKKCGLI